MRIMVIEAGSVVADLSFSDEDVTIGSSAEATINLPDMRVSGENVLITPTEDGQWLIENLDPGNAVNVNAHVLTDRLTLQNDDEVTLQDYMLKIYLETELEQRAVAETDVVVDDLARIREFPLPAGSVVRRHDDPVNLTRNQLDRASLVTLEISGSRDIHQFVETVVSQLIRIFEARSAWLGVRRSARGELEIQGGKLASGKPCDMNPVIELLQYRCVDRAQHICIRKVRDHEIIASAMAVPLVTRSGTLGMLYVDRQRRTKRFRSSDLDLLSAVGTHIAIELEAVVQERLQRSVAVSTTEASVVHSIQAQLDPKSSPSFDTLQLAAYSRSGQSSPGAIYDVMQHPDNPITAIMLGHVDAEGASLALSMARLHSTFRVGFLHNDPPHALARALNWLMYDEKDPATVDALFLLIDPQSARMKCARAGKVGAFVVDPSGQPRVLKTVDAPAIGRARNYEYVSSMEQLAPGETLVLYTRGAATCTNGDGERFGEHRFIELVCDGFGQPPSTALQDVSEELSAFFADGSHPDDITIVLLHRRPV